MRHRYIISLKPQDKCKTAFSMLSGLVATRYDAYEIIVSSSHIPTDNGATTTATSRCQVYNAIHR